MAGELHEIASREQYMNISRHSTNDTENFPSIESTHTEQGIGTINLAKTTDHLLTEYGKFVSMKKLNYINLFFFYIGIDLYWSL